MDISFLHSGGENNKRPDFDLGGPISLFEIADQTLNNLFDDITPDEGENGFIDYRCFYIQNGWNDLQLTNPILTLAGDSTISYGLNEQDDIQRFTFLGGTPDPSGYIIVSNDFGPPITVIFGGDFNTMASNFQKQLRQLRFCSTCTVVNNITSPPTIDITFKGQVGRRNTTLMTILVNRLQSTEGGNFIIANYTGSNPFNNINNTQVKVTDPIDVNSFPFPGTLYVFNVATDQYVGFQYISLTGQNILNLSSPLTFSLIAYDVLILTPISTKEYLVKIRKIQEGSPINTVTPFITNKTTAPANIIFETSNITDLGTIFALESIPIWIKRDITAGTPAKKNDSFSITLTGTLLT